MELRLLLLLFRRWFWLLFLGAAIGASAGYYYSISQPSVYRSSTKIMVMQPRESLASDLTALTDAELAETFRNLLVVKPVLEATSERIGGLVSAGQVSSRVIEGTQLLVVTVTDKDPERAALVANTLVESLIEQNESLQSNRFEASEESLQGQISQIEAQMEALRAQVGQRAELSVEEIEGQREALAGEIPLLSENIVQLEEDIARLSTADTSQMLSPVESKMLDEKQIELALVESQLIGAKSHYEELLSAGAYEGELELQKERLVALVEQKSNVEKEINNVIGSSGVLSVLPEASVLGDAGEGVVVPYDTLPTTLLSPEELELLDEKYTDLDILTTQVNGARSRYEELIASGSHNGELEARRLRVVDLAEQKAQLEKSIASLTSNGESAVQGEERLALLREKRSELTLLQFNLELAKERYQRLLYPETNPSLTNSQDVSQDDSVNIALYQQIYSSLLSDYEAVRLARMQGTPNVVQVELAVPGGPVRPNEISTAILWATIGLIITGSIAFVIEYLDDTIKTSEDVEAVVGLPVIGHVGETKELKDERQESNRSPGPYLSKYPRAPLGEAFRSLRTNLEFSDVDHSLKMILVTSSGPSEGKTTIAANLAEAFNQQQKRVVLLDCDMRRPSLHKVYGISNRKGLSNVLIGQMDVQDCISMFGTNLMVIPSGTLPSNPSELLGSDRMTQFLKELREIADVIVVDSPPSIVTDPAVLSTKVDGVILVAQPGKTRADDVEAQVRQLERAGARIVGVVLNLIPRRRAGYYGRYAYRHRYYDYGYSHYSSDGDSGRGRRSKRGRWWPFGRKSRRSEKKISTGVEGEV